MPGRWILAGALWVLVVAGCAAPVEQPTPPAPEATPSIAATQPTPQPDDVPTAVAFSASDPASCTVVSVIPQPDPAIAALFPPITEDDWVFGPPDAAVTILEYSDMQCPYCALLDPVLAQLRKDFPDDVRYVFRHFPLSIHANAFAAAQAVEAAGLQQKFAEMKHALFAQQQVWSNHTPQQFTAWALEQASALGLDAQQFAADFASEAVKARVQADADEAAAIGLPGTPFLLINDAPYQGPRDYFSLATIVRLYALQAKQYHACPEMAVDPAREYTATIETEIGNIVVELFVLEAPFTVNNFIFLAREGWYDGVSFHRVLPGFVAQAGDPSGTGYGGPGYAFSNEVTPDLRFDQAGLLAMANAGPEANGSQFFLTYAPQPDLDGRFTIFGRVISGMEVLAALQPRDPQQGGDLPAGTLIKTIIIQEN